ncbi:MAG TPA: carbon-nitrogen hydrolase family protein [Polyangiaceae bacterium]|nr:carbon-nitrogen hydrolase family protein [Polyangiaceae bacterium]
MSHSPLTVAAIQLSSQDDVAGNLAQCRQWLERAAQAGAKLAVLPENFAFFGPDAARVKLAEPLLAAGTEAAPIQRALAGWARELGITIVGGGMPTQSGDAARPFNTAVVFGPDGRLLGHYHKVHLFDVSLSSGEQLRESSHTARGESLATLGVAGFEVGLSICYDVRFPELYRGLVDRGAEVILVPAAFTLHTGKDHWAPLLQARAIESQAWVVAAGQWGSHPGGRRCHGHSMVVDPWGAIIAQCPDRQGFALATLDHEYQQQVRASVPSLQHRRLR